MIAPFSLFKYFSLPLLLWSGSALAGTSNTYSPLDLKSIKKALEVSVARGASNPFILGCWGDCPSNNNPTGSLIWGVGEPASPGTAIAHYGNGAGSSAALTEIGGSGILTVDTGGYLNSAGANAHIQLDNEKGGAAQLVVGAGGKVYAGSSDQKQSALSVGVAAKGETAGGGTAVVTVKQGGLLQVNGNALINQGEIDVSGGGSKFNTVDSNLDVGAPGLLKISNGATFTADSKSAVEDDGKIEVSGKGTQANFNNLYISGTPFNSSLATAGSGTLSITDGALVKVIGSGDKTDKTDGTAITVGYKGAGGAALVNVNSGGSLEFGNGVFNVGNANSVVNIDGSDGGASIYGDGGSLNFQSGTLNIKNGGTLVASGTPGYPLKGDSYVSNAQMNIDGSGSKLDLSNTSYTFGCGAGFGPKNCGVQGDWSGKSGGVYLTNGASASFNNITLGEYGGTGTLSVDNSTLNASDIKQGKGGKANFTINGKRANVKIDSIISASDPSDSFNVNVENGATLKVASALTQGKGGKLNLALSDGNLDIAGDKFTSNATISLTGSDSIQIDKGVANFAGLTQGTGSLVKKGTGTLALTSSNTYTGGTLVEEGTLLGGGASFGTGDVSVAQAATLEVTKGSNIFKNTLSGTGTVDVDSGATVALNQKSFGNMLTGTGDVDVGTSSTSTDTQVLDAVDNTVSFTGDSSGFGGHINVSNGTLDIETAKGVGGDASTINLNRGGKLTGNGLIGGSLSVGNGAELAMGGGQSQTEAFTLLQEASESDPLVEESKNIGLTVHKDLTLSDGSSITFNSSDNTSAMFNLVDVGQNFKIDNATLNINASNLADGTYTLVEYGTSGTGNRNGRFKSTLLNGSSFDPKTEVINYGQKGIVQIIKGEGINANEYWNPHGSKNGNAVSGGDGTWTATDSDWTKYDGTDAAAFESGKTAVFEGDGGTVTVDDSKGQVVASGLNFQPTDNGKQYTITGGAIQSFDKKFTLWADSSGATVDVNIEDSDKGPTQLVKTGSGTVVLGDKDQMTYTGGTEVGQGRLEGAANVFGKGNIAVDQGAVLAINQTTDATLAHLVTGKGIFEKMGSGNLTLQDNNTYSGGTLIDDNSGTLTGSTTSFGSGVISIGDKSTLALNDTKGTSSSFSNLIEGKGQLVKDGSDTVTLGDQNIYSGGTDIKSGTLQGTAFSFGTGLINIADKANLNINQTKDAEMSNVLTGSGTFNKSGSGLVYYNQKSDKFTGQSNIKEGSFDIGSSGDMTGSAFTISKGSTLSGTGKIGSADVFGSLSAGYDQITGTYGPLTSKGNVTMEKGSNLQAALGNDSTKASLDVGGIFNANGSTLGLSAGGAGNIDVNKTYEVIHADGGVDGKFGSVGQLENHSLLYASTPTYSKDDVKITFGIKQGANFGDGGVTRNQIASGNGLNTLRESGKDQSLVNIIAGMSDQNRQKALTSLSGEINADSRTAMINDAFYIRDAVINRLGCADDLIRRVVMGSAGYCATRSDKPVSVWGTVYGSQGNQSGHHGYNVASHMSNNSVGWIMGGDALIGHSHKWRAGGVLAYGRDFYSSSGIQSSGRSNNVSVGAYGGTSWRVGGIKPDARVTLKLGADYTWDIMNNRRTVNMYGATANQFLSSEQLGGTGQVYGETGYKFIVAGKHVPMELEPFVRMTYLNYQEGGFKEHGGMAALKGKSKDSSIGYSTLGFKAATAFVFKKITFAPHLMAAYRRAFGATNSLVRERFAAGGGIGGYNMNVVGTPISTNTALLELGGTVTLSNRFSLDLNYIGQYGNYMVTSAGTGNIKFHF